MSDERSNPARPARYALFDTALGVCGVAWTDRGLVAVQLPEATPEATLARLSRKARAAAVREGDGEGSANEANGANEKAPAWVADAVDRIVKHLAGEPQDFRVVPLDLEGTGAFDEAVYRALREVPAGATLTYGELAARVGSPGGARAVGRAMATNPWPIVVPCQRVLAAGNKGGGFSAYGGLVTKDRLLALDGADVRVSPSRDASEPDPQLGLFAR